MKICRSPGRHQRIRAYQDVFTDNKGRLFHRVTDRRVPADNNRAERDLRPAVIERKVISGSSSDDGAETRSILMSVLHTVNKGRGRQSPESVFTKIFYKITENPDVDVAPLVLPAKKQRK